MKYGSTISDIKYKVNEKERTVKCTIVCSMKVPHGNNLTKQAVYSVAMYSLKGAVFTGTAKCHEDDHFSEVIGKRIAESRAKKAMYDYYVNLWGRILTKCIASVDEIENTLNQYISLSSYEKEHIQKLIHS